MRAALLALLSFVLVVFLAPAVFADVAPPNLTQCNGKSPGTACTTDDGKDGACQTNTCSKLDYSDGTPPTTVTYPCLQCTAGAVPSSSATSTSTASTTPSEGGSGCTLGQAAHAVGPWALASIVPAIVLLARRRRSARR